MSIQVGTTRVGVFTSDSKFQLFDHSITDGSHILFTGTGYSSPTGMLVPFEGDYVLFGNSSGVLTRYSTVDFSLLDTTSFPVSSIIRHFSDIERTGYFFLVRTEPNMWVVNKTDFTDKSS